MSDVTELDLLWGGSDTPGLADWGWDTTSGAASGGIGSRTLGDMVKSIKKG